MTGILLVDKEQDWTSSDVVARLRGLLHERRIGHAGTLDPLATGLLIVMVGRAARASDYLMRHPKQYRAHFRPGIVTDTQDITGRVLTRKNVTPPSKSAGRSSMTLPAAAERWSAHREPLPFPLSRLPGGTGRILSWMSPVLPVPTSVRSATTSGRFWDAVPA